MYERGTVKRFQGLSQRSRRDESRGDSTLFLGACDLFATQMLAAFGFLTGCRPYYNSRKKFDFSVECDDAYDLFYVPKLLK